MAEALPTVAVFDFDNTLIAGDSLWPFLTATAGWIEAIRALTETLWLYAKEYLQNSRSPDLADPRTFIKAHLLRKLLAGRRVEELPQAIASIKRWQQARLNDQVCRILLDHSIAGHRIVIASGGLDVYLPELLKSIPHHAVVCTQMEIKDGVLTGEMASGNCVRERKAEMVKEWLGANGPFGESWGYGNFPHDVPMLQLVKQRVIV